MSVKENCTSCFKGLSVPSRMQIYTFLERHKKARVSEVVKVVGLRQPTISYHLKEMEHDGLLKSQKVGKEVYYTVSHFCPYDGGKCVLE